eukprot:164965_1
MIYIWIHKRKMYHQWRVRNCLCLKMIHIGQNKLTLKRGQKSNFDTLSLSALAHYFQYDILVVYYEYIDAHICLSWHMKTISFCVFDFFCSGYTQSQIYKMDCIRW